MRGKEAHDPETGEPNRITPAYAGKSSCPLNFISRNRDHPRICGEKFLPVELHIPKQGSPPHMRGKAAGGKMPRLRNGDHPRICGEKLFVLNALAHLVGSPPHMRGKVSCQGLKDCSTRITPAYAGKRLKRSRSTVSHAAIVPLFPSVCNKPAGSDGSPAGHDAPPFLPIENAAPASPAYNLRSL